MTNTVDLRLEEDQIMDLIAELEADLDRERARLRDLQARIAEAEAASDRAWHHMGVI
jgi:predicted  nucleic acid-binding Zn-ribbon protein